MDQLASMETPLGFKAPRGLTRSSAKRAAPWSGNVEQQEPTPFKRPALLDRLDEVARPDEVLRLEEEVEELRKKLDEEQEATRKASHEHALELLREKHKREELEIGLGHVQRSEASWRAKYVGECERREEERRSHLEERVRLMQSAREEYTAEAEEQSHELRRTISSLQSDLQAAKKEAAVGTSQSLHPADALAADKTIIEQLLRDTADPLPVAPGEWQGPRVGALGDVVRPPSGQPALQRSSAFAGSALRGSAELEALRRAEDAEAAREALTAQLRKAERQVASAADVQTLYEATRRELQELRASRHAASVAGASGGTFSSATSSSDHAELRRQIEAAEALRETHNALLTRHAQLEVQVQSWCALFAAELDNPAAAAAAAPSFSSSSAGVRRVLTDEGLPEAGAAEAVRTRLRELRARERALVAEEGQLQSVVRTLEAAEATAARELTGLRSELASAQQRASAAEARAEREGARASGSETAREHDREYILKLEADRERLRLTKASGAPAESSGASAEGRSSTEDDAVAAAGTAALRVEIKVLQDRCQLLDRHVSASAVKEAAAAAEVRQAKLEAADAKAAAKAASARVSELERLSGDQGAGGRGAPKGGAKVLSLKDNPASQAQGALLDSLRAKVSSLEMQLRLLQESNAVLAEGSEAASAAMLGAAAAAEHAAATLAAQNVANELRRQVSELEMDKLKLQKGFESAFKSNIKRFRESSMKITGYRIDMRHLEGSKAGADMFDVYLIDHVRKEPLHFRLSDADHAQAEILPSPLLEKLLAEHPSLEDYLKVGNFAAFLAAATLELNKKARAS